MKSLIVHTRGGAEIIFEDPNALTQLAAKQDIHANGILDGDIPAEGEYYVPFPSVLYATTHVSGADPVVPEDDVCD